VRRNQLAIILGLCILLVAALVLTSCNYANKDELREKTTVTESTQPQKQGEKARVTAPTPSGSAPTAQASSAGSATIQFSPYTPLDLSGQTGGFVEGPAGGIQFIYLPVQQVVWGYRVYLTPKPPGAKWIKDEDGYYCDFRAAYSPVGYTGAYRQPDPQPVILDGLEAGTRYQYKVLPLCITGKAPWNLDKYGKPFQYGFVGGANLYFIWVYTDKSDWGVVDKPGGEAEKGYYLVYSLVAEGEFTAKRSGGGGGGGGGLIQ